MKSRTVRAIEIFVRARHLFLFLWYSIVARLLLPASLLTPLRECTRAGDLVCVRGAQDYVEEGILFYLVIIAWLFSVLDGKCGEKGSFVLPLLCRGRQVAFPDRSTFLLRFLLHPLATYLWEGYKNSSYDNGCYSFWCGVVCMWVRFHECGTNGCHFVEQSPFVWVDVFGVSWSKKKRKTLVHGVVDLLLRANRVVETVDSCGRVLC